MRYCNVLMFFLFSQLVFGQVRQVVVNIPFENYIQNSQHHLRNAFQIALPIFGSEALFDALPNDVMDDDLMRAYPKLRTYDLSSAAYPDAYGALTVSEFGVFVTIFNINNTSLIIRPQDFTGSTKHEVEYGIKRSNATCGHVDHVDSDNVDVSNLIDRDHGLRNVFQLGTTRYRYDVAIICTGEYYQANGNTNSTVTTSITQSVNNISAVYKKDLSITLQSSSSRMQLHSDPATDPFIPDGSGGEARTVQAGRAIKTRFADNIYDIGHVFHTHADGDGWTSGGLAQLYSVCDNNTSPTGEISKGSAWSGAYRNDDLGWVLLAAHEFGHQFGATHTFNGDGNSCTTAINLTSAVEIGSGTTIMSYEGLCNDSDNIPSNGIDNDYFHIVSIQQMMDYIVNNDGNICATKSNSNNNIPEVLANPCNANYSIPKGTPFYLSGTATDADSDPMTYTWEEIDEDGAGKPTHGWVGSQAAGSAIAPLFRSYQPSITPERYFPTLEVLKNGGSDFEVLPTVARTMNFAFTARDNNAAGSAVAMDNITINVANSGPFVISRPAGGETLRVQQPETITWNTNGSNSLCNMVRIKVSTDGGETFDRVLAENIPYASGTTTITLPANFFNTTTARFMIECMDSDCFKIFTVSNQNVTISSNCKPEVTVLCPTSKVTMNEGDPNPLTGMSKVMGADKITRTLSENSSVGRVVVLAETGTGCADISNYYVSAVPIYVTEPGKYTFFAEGSGFMSLFRSGYKPTDGCARFISSTRRQSGTQITGANQAFEVTLSACTEYVLVFYSFSTLPATVSAKVLSGPGLVIEKIAPATSTYINRFVVVNNGTGLIYTIMDTPDVTGIPTGNYTIYAIVMENLNVSTLVGTSFQTFVGANCVNLSPNSRILEVLPNCRILSVTAGAATPCILGDNTFTQEVIVTYEKAPTTGNLSVNGQLFAITTSPQSVVLTGLDSDGADVDGNAFFTDTPNCKFDAAKLFTAPVNCCPVQVELGQDANLCVGDKLTLDGGATGASFIWKRDGLLLSSNSRTIEVSTSGKYLVEVVHASGCRKSDSINVTFHPLPVINLPATTAFCQNESTVIIATLDQQNYTISWEKDGVTIPGQNTNTLTVNQTGTYKIVVTSQYTCSASKEIVVSQITTPVVNIGNEINKCQGEEIILDAGAGGNNYLWYKDGVLLSETTQSLNVTESGTYRVFVEFGNNCAAEDDVLVRIFESPVLDELPALFDICNGEKATIVANGSGYTSLQWYFNGNIINGSINPSIQVAISGEYSVTVKNAGGCAVTRTTTVDTHSAPSVDLGQDIVACIGPEVTLFAGNEGTSYQWTKDGAPISGNVNAIKVSTNGVFAVTVTNDFDCVTTDDVMVTFVNGPTLDLGSDVTICSGETYTIKAVTNTPSASIIWNKNGIVIPLQNGFDLNVTEAGEYEAVVFGGTPPCEVRARVTVKVNPKPGINLGVDKAICEGDAFPTFDAGPNHKTYAWTYNGAAAGSTRTILADKSGIYSATVTNNFDCTNTDEVRLTINPLPTLTIPTKVDLCKGDTITLDPQTNATKFEWSKDGTVIPSATMKALIVTTPGTYAITVSTTAKCAKDTTITVTERSLPTVSLGRDTVICPNQSITLNAGQHTTYTWSNGATTQTLVVNASQLQSEPVIFGVTVKNQYQCSATDSVSITARPKVVADIEADNVGVCNGEPVNLLASGGLFYAWSDPDNSLSSTTTAGTIAMPTQTTIYTVTVTDDCPGNTDTATLELKVFEPQDISAGVDTCLITGTTIQLQAFGGVTYDWSPKTAIIGVSNIANPEISIVEPTTFIVTITDTNGCAFADSVFVCVEEDPLKFFKAVTMITPNGDGANDVLLFRGLEYYPDNTLTIFNRWGNVIYEAVGYQSSIADLFDGTKNGERLPPDTYYYILQFDGKTFKNSLTIIRD